jgi:hypothetical protein
MKDWIMVLKAADAAARWQLEKQFDVAALAAQQSLVPMLSRHHERHIPEIGGDQE